MRIPARNTYAYCRTALRRGLNGICKSYSPVFATALIPSGIFRRFSYAACQFRVLYRILICRINNHSAAESRRFFFAAHSVHIGGFLRCYNHSQIGAYAVRCGSSSSRARFALCGKHEIRVVFTFRIH